MIQNALGGKLESTKICCDRCNYQLELLIDSAFNGIFAPFTSDIKDFKKTHNKSSTPAVSGYAIYRSNSDKKLVSANVIKKDSIKQSYDIIHLLKDDLNSEDLNSRIKSALKNSRTIFQDFKLDNHVFKQGLSKIAFNFAIYSGISVDKLKCAYKITLGGKYSELNSVHYETIIVPFYPGNEFDKHIETNIDFVIFHNLILFQYVGALWCYINLFNTFQYYVLLNEDYDSNQLTMYEIVNNEFQYVQSNIDNIYTSYHDYISSKAEEFIISTGRHKMSYDFYFPDNKINPCYRIINPLKCDKGMLYEQIFYPWWIPQAMERGQIDIKSYATKKYTIFNQYLLKDKPWLRSDFSQSFARTDTL